MQAAAKTGVTRFGAIDAVVANAGTEHWAPVQTVEPDAFRRVIETNLIGVFHTVRAALPSIIDQRGYILVVASASSYTAVPGMAAYGASKAGVDNLRMYCGSRSPTTALASARRTCRWSIPRCCAKPSPIQGVSPCCWQHYRDRCAAPSQPDKCAVRLVDAIEHRKRHVDVPRWAAAA
jgi:hypothetical protein